MFETSQLTARAAVQRRYGLLAVSVVIHTAVVAAVLFATVRSISFPTRSPDELLRYTTVPPMDVPKPLGRQAAREPAAAQHEPRPTVAPAGSAPDRIPDAVLPATGSGRTADPNAPIGDASSSDEIGDPSGRIGGVDIGQPAARTEGPPVVYQPVGEVRPAVALQRVEPQYPRTALAAHLAGTVVIECVIDKEGHARDAHVLRSSSPIFDEPALAALRQWKFAPGMLRGGPVDTWFQLTVAFRLR